MGLISSVYRLAPPPVPPETAREREQYLRRLVLRVVRERGHEAVLTAIDAYPVPSGLLETKATLARIAWTIREA